MQIYALKPMADNQKSYYGKATVIINGDAIILKSYDTMVAAYDLEKKTFRRLWDGYSVTTMKHINSFIYALHLIDYGTRSPFPADAHLQGGKKWWLSLEMYRDYPKTALYRDI